MATRKSELNDDHRGVARVGFATIVLTFGVLGGWAAMAPLGSAIVAPGYVTAEMNRKTVQHLEGGIVSKIMVREGEFVERGQPLFMLDDTGPRANLEIIRNQLHSNLARESRLVAELDWRSEIEWSPELLAADKDPVVLRAMDDQKSQFRERRASVEGQLAILSARQDQLRREIEGLDRQKKSCEEQIAFIIDELTGLRGLLEKNFVPKTRVLAMERERARLEGEIGRFEAERAKAEKAIGESVLQAQQIKQQFQEQAGRDLGETREKLNDLRSKSLVAQDVLRRLSILAPVSGTVQNLKVFTVGAVIRPSDPLLEIAPAEDNLVIQAHVSPLDIESMTSGREAEVRFPAFHEKTLPMIPGKVASVSRDRLIDDASKQPYFLAIVTVDNAAIPEQYRGKVISGMNAEVIVPTYERTAIQYLVEPLIRRMRTTFREQ